MWNLPLTSMAFWLITALYASLGRFIPTVKLRNTGTITYPAAKTLWKYITLKKQLTHSCKEGVTTRNRGPPLKGAIVKLFANCLVAAWLFLAEVNYTTVYQPYHYAVEKKN